jgi:hypothetical protein
VEVGRRKPCLLYRSTSAKRELYADLRQDLARFLQIDVMGSPDHAYSFLSSAARRYGPALYSFVRAARLPYGG